MRIIKVVVVLVFCLTMTSGAKASGVAEVVSGPAVSFVETELLDLKNEILLLSNEASDINNDIYSNVMGKEKHIIELLKNSPQKVGLLENEILHINYIESEQPYHDFMYFQSLKNILGGLKPDLIFGTAEKVLASNSANLYTKKDIFGFLFRDHFYKNHGLLKQGEITEERLNDYNLRLVSLGRKLFKRGGCFDIDSIKSEIDSSKNNNTVDNVQKSISLSTLNKQYSVYSEMKKLYIDVLLGYSDIVGVNLIPVNIEEGKSLLKEVINDQSVKFYDKLWAYQRLAGYDSIVKEKLVSKLKDNISSNDIEAYEKVEYGQLLLEYGEISSEQLDLLKQKSEPATFGTKKSEKQVEIKGHNVKQ